MTPGARVAAAIELIAEIADGARPADAIVQDYFRQRRYAGSKDRAAIQTQVYGTLRRLGGLRWRVTQRDGPSESSRTLVLAHLALQGTDVETLCSGQGHAPAPLTPGERDWLRDLGAQDETSMPTAARLNVPEWLWPRLVAAFGERIDVELAGLNTPGPVDLRVNLLRGPREAAQASLAENGIVAEPTPISPWGLRLTKRAPLGGSRAFRDGWVEPQDEGSQLLALVADAQAGQTVVDLCAGAGGKTLALAASMAGDGNIIACDTAAGRLGRGKARLQRAGVDGMVSLRNAPGLDGSFGIAAGSADRVLVDVPCSGTGVWRRQPEARWRFTPETLTEHLALQRNLMTNAARLVKPGGRLIYATCSVLREENEDQVDAFLEGRDDFRRCDVTTLVPDLVRLTDTDVVRPDLRLTPAAHGTDGVYAAVLERRR